MAQVPQTAIVNRNEGSNVKKYKLVVLGNQAVGKTTLTYKLCEDKFLDAVEATIGVDLRSFVVNVEGEDIKVMYVRICILLLFHITGQLCCS